MSRTRTVPTPNKHQWTVDELSELYVEKNFSMDLVSTVTGIPLAPLSRIFWDNGLPDRKRAYYDNCITGELSKVPPGMMPLYFDEKYAQPYGGRQSSPDELVDEFLKGLD